MAPSTYVLYTLHRKIQGLVQVKHKYKNNRVSVRFGLAIFKTVSKLANFKKAFVLVHTVMQA
jgi:hypothetical protein